MKASIFNIKASGVSSSLPCLNDVRFPYEKLTALVTKLQFAIANDTQKTTIITIEDTSAGEFFADEAATQSLGTSVSYTTGGQKIVFYKAYKSSAIIMRYPEDVTAIGTKAAMDWNPIGNFASNSNIAITEFDITQISACPKLEVFQMGGLHTSKGSVEIFGETPAIKGIVMATKDGSYFEGSSVGLRGKVMRHINITGLRAFDVKDIPTVAFIELNGTQQLINSGSNAIPSITTAFTYLIMRASNRLSAAHTDLFLQALAASLPNASARTYQISGTRTAASDAAIATLLGKGYTINLL